MNKPTLYSLDISLSNSTVPQQRLQNSSLGTQGMALYIKEGFRSFRQSKLKCSCDESRGFRICRRIIFMCMAFTVTRGTMVHFMIVLDSMARVQSVDDKAVFVFLGDANAHHPEWLGSVSSTDRHGRDALDFVICRVAISWFAVPLTLLVTESTL